MVADSPRNVAGWIDGEGREDDISRPTRAILSMGRNFAGSKICWTRGLHRRGLWDLVFRPEKRRQNADPDNKLCQNRLSANNGFSGETVSIFDTMPDNIFFFFFKVSYRILINLAFELNINPIIFFTYFK